VVLGFVLKPTADLRIGLVNLVKLRLYVVLSALIEICERERCVRPASVKFFEGLVECGILMGRSMKWCVMNEDEVKGVTGAFFNEAVDRSSKEGVIAVEGVKSAVNHGEAVDEMNLEVLFSDDRCCLRYRQVREIRVINEVRRKSK
jgi:hypothetical protein